ncbi:hypothetical protein [Actinoplanes regularis]|uniref:Protein kinase domain-containing protein n=1 Tax=Actinoplanes regularis TaxID=52697 RepID=A0A239C5K7_9ACTN|nr:hypothetical protein [Actinoplanes regularis]GIE88120.1 hypothetical protein Are01nite_46000 [Actinoplanes regularis]SNS14958.1 hypothetical protein SAMN06264365_110296 [Actinoplanes regularis]
MPGPAAVPVTALRPSAAQPLLLPEGGTATVAQVEYEGRPYLFKRYHDEHRSAVRPGELDRLIAWQTRGSRADQQVMNAIAAWPRYAVWDRDGLAGMLIRPAPGAYFHRDRPRALDMLPDPGDGRPGERRDALAIRLNAFGHLVAAITWFHDRGVMINDLHAHNVLVSRFGDGVHLVDCDSMTGLHWRPVLPPPRNVAPDAMRAVIPGVDDPSQATDFARLAYVIISLLAGDEMEEIGEPTVEQLAGMIGDPMARFLCKALAMVVPVDDADRVWRVLGRSWREVAVWATAGGAEVTEPEPLWEPPLGTLLPPGFTFPRLDLSMLERPLVVPPQSVLERKRSGGVRAFLNRRFGVRWTI